MERIVIVHVGALAIGCVIAPIAMSGALRGWPAHLVVWLCSAAWVVACVAGVMWLGRAATRAKMPRLPQWMSCAASTAGAAIALSVAVEACTRDTAWTVATLAAVVIMTFVFPWLYLQIRCRGGTPAWFDVVLGTGVAACLAMLIEGYRFPQHTGPFSWLCQADFLYFLVPMTVLVSSIVICLLPRRARLPAVLASAIIVVAAQQTLRPFGIVM